MYSECSRWTQQLHAASLQSFLRTIIPTSYSLKFCIEGMATASIPAAFAACIPNFRVVCRLNIHFCSSIPLLFSEKSFGSSKRHRAILIYFCCEYENHPKARTLNYFSSINYIDYTYNTKVSIRRTRRINIVTY